MQINVSPSVFLNARCGAPSLRGKVKSRVQDFRVFEQENRETFIDPARLCTEFTSLSDADFVLTTAKPLAEAVQESSIDAEEYMHCTGLLPQIAHLNEWITKEELAPNAHSEIIFEAPASKDNRRLLYEYVKEHFPYCKAEKTADDNGHPRFAVVADRSLLPLRDAGLPLHDVTKIYLYLSAGPLTKEAAAGISVGHGLNRAVRTAVYKSLAKMCPLLDCKTLDDGDTGMKKQQLFWRRSVRERMQKQADRIKINNSICVNNDIAPHAPLLMTSAATADTSTPKRSREESDSTPSKRAKPLGPEQNTEGAASVVAVCVQLPRYIKFALVKNNTEQSDAFKMLADVMRRLVDYYKPCPGESIAELRTLGLFDKSFLHSFSVSGTKDKRGVTSQRCCVEVLPSWVNKNTASVAAGSTVLESLSAEQSRYGRIMEAAVRCLLSVNKPPSEQRGFDGRGGINVGDVTYAHAPLSLGEHWGNRFDVTIRDVKLTPAQTQNSDNDTSGCAVCKIRKHVLPAVDRTMGFPNYFGTQRFGYSRPDPVAADEDGDSTADSGGGVVADSAGGATSDRVVAEDVAEYDDESIVLGGEMPLGPQVGKFLIQQDFVSAAHHLLLGNKYKYNGSEHRVTEIGNWTCLTCSGTFPERVHNEASKKSVAVAAAREMYAHGTRPSVVAKKLPSHMTKEKWLLQGLVRYCGDRNGLNEATFTRCCSNCGCVSDEAIAPQAQGKGTGEVTTQEDYQRAVDAIPYAARTIWIHAYGSWLWNKVANYRLFQCPIAEAGSRGAAMKGDLVSATGMECSSGVNKSSYNIERLCDGLTNATVSSVILPLFGSNVIFPGGSTGRYYRQLLIDDGFELVDIIADNGEWESFRLIPSAGLTKGAYRKIIQFPGGGTVLDWTNEGSDDEPLERSSGVGAGGVLAPVLDSRVVVKTRSPCYRHCSSGGGDTTAMCTTLSGQGALDDVIRFQFSLPAGSYATVFLRELLGSDDMLL